MLLRSAGVGFFGTQVVAVITAACSNYLINNLTSQRRLRGRSLVLGC